MDDQNINLFKQKLIEKYSGTFDLETEKSLRELEATEQKISNRKYHLIAANCAIYLLQKTQEASAYTLDFFRQCTYEVYIENADTLIFKIEFGDALRKIKASIVNLIDDIIPATYIQLGFSGIAIDKNAASSLVLSDFFNKTQCSYLEIPVLLNKAGLDYFYWTVNKIENNTIDREEACKEMILKLSTILIASHGLYNILFEHEQFNKD